MDQYSRFPLYYKTIRLEWYRFPHYFTVRQGDIYCRKRDTRYREEPYPVSHVALESVGDWIELVLVPEQIRIRFTVA